MDSEPPAANEPAAIQERIDLGRIRWVGPLALTTARTVLLLVVQAVVALAFLVRGHPSPWRAQAPWWSVYATVVDIACLVLLRRQARREGIGLADLLGVDRSHLGREVLWGLAYLLVLFPVVQAGTVFASWIVYGTPQADFARLAPGLLVARRLPPWAVGYSLSVFWLLWSPTEELTYQAYCAARLRALTGRTWLTLALVGFWWALQHSVLPLILEWRLCVFRFLQFLPLVMLMQILYLRTRRLPRMIVMHWPMDLLAARLTLAP
jgi:CAAX prenyl protease-like protein